MPERPTPPADLDSLNWGDAGTPYTTTLIPSGKRSIGWQPKDESPPGVANPGTAGEIITAPYRNWFWKLLADSINHILGFAPREYAEPSEGIAATSAPQRFVVHAPSAGLREYADEDYSQQGPGGAWPVSHVCSDGQCLYVAQTTGAGIGVYNLDPDDAQAPAAGNWSNVSFTSVNCLETDGIYIWGGGTTATDDGLFRLPRATGIATFYNGHGAAATIDLVACNGKYVACVDDTNADRLHVYQSDGTYDGYYTAASASHDIVAVCISGPNAYIVTLIPGGGASTDFEVECVALATRTQVWTSGVIASVAAVTAANITCDGRRVYVAHTRSNFDAAGDRTVTCFAVADGTILWFFDQATSCDDGIWADPDALYVSDGSGTLSLDKATGYKGGGNLTIPKVRGGDGVSLFGIDTNNIERNWLGKASMEFQRVGGDDGNRVPWPGMLAIPTGRNL